MSCSIAFSCWLAFMRAVAVILGVAEGILAEGRRRRYR